GEPDVPTILPLVPLLIPVIPVPSPIKLNELAGSTGLAISLLLAPEFREFPATMVLCNVRVLVLPNSLLAIPPPMPFVPATLLPLMVLLLRARLTALPEVWLELAMPPP